MVDPRACVLHIVSKHLDSLVPVILLDRHRRIERDALPQFSPILCQKRALRQSTLQFGYFDTMDRGSARQGELQARLDQVRQ